MSHIWTEFPPTSACMRGGFAQRAPDVEQEHRLAALDPEYAARSSTASSLGRADAGKLSR